MRNTSSSERAGQAQSWMGFLVAVAIFIAVGAVFIGGAAPGALVLAGASETAW